MNKNKVGTAIGALSILPVIISVIFFYATRGPNADIYFTIKIFAMLSTLGIVFAGVGLKMAKGSLSKIVIGLIGLIANVTVLAAAFLLLLAMGISEP